MNTKILNMNKKGEASGRMMSILFICVLVGALAGTIFGTDGLNATAFTSNAPSWLPTVLRVGVGIALVGLVIGRRM